MSNPQAQGAPGGQQQTLLRPDDILKLQCLAEDAKQKYRLIMQNCWSMTQTHPQGSQEWNQAMAKLREWSSQLIQKERAFRMRSRQQQQENQGQPSGQNQQNQVAQQNQAKQQQQQAQPQPSGDTEQQAAPAQQAQGQQQTAPQNQAQPNPQSQIDPQIVKHIQEFPFCLPPNGPQIGTPAGDAKLKDLKSKYLNALLKQQKLATQVRKFAQQLTERQKAGQDVGQEFMTHKQQAESEYQQMKKSLTTFREQQNQWKQEHEQQRGQQGQAQQTQSQQPQQSSPQQQQQQPPTQQQSQPPQPQRQPSQPTIKEEPQIKVEGSQTSQSQSQPASQFGNMQGSQPQSLSQQNAQGPTPPLSQQQQQQPPRQPPTPISQQNQPPGQAPQFAQPGQPQAHQQPQRPQINPHQANAHQHTQSNSPHPQSAVSNPNAAPVPLSHQAAMSAANRSYTDPQRTTTPMQPNPQGSFHNQGSRERDQMNNPKMPIPRALNVTAPTPVNMGQARPTMSGPTNGAPGPMGQPVIPKFPPFQLEGEGDRVLSKRKLDELVRQVTGGSEEALTPEVEEAVLQLADDFVDTVISNACKLSKLRESPQLDIRDIQLVLERNYNIRIPGYASDEVRTVRKIVPAPGWVEKMKAVSAAKVMGGKTDI